MGGAGSHLPRVPRVTLWPREVIASPTCGRADGRRCEVGAQAPAQGALLTPSSNRLPVWIPAPATEAPTESDSKAEASQTERKSRRKEIIRDIQETKGIKLAVLGNVELRWTSLRVGYSLLHFFEVACSRIADGQSSASQNPLHPVARVSLPSLHGSRLAAFRPQPSGAGDSASRESLENMLVDLACSKRPTPSTAPSPRPPPPAPADHLSQVCLLLVSGGRYTSWECAAHSPGQSPTPGRAPVRNELCRQLPSEVNGCGNQACVGPWHPLPLPSGCSSAQSLGGTEARGV